MISHQWAALQQVVRGLAKQPASLLPQQRCLAMLLESQISSPEDQALDSSSTSVRQVSTDQASQAAAPAQAPQTAGKDPPWMPSRDRHKQSFLPRRMAHLTRVLEDELAAKAQAERKLPDFDTGDALELQLITPENQGRESVFKGLCIAREDRGYRTSFTLRNHIPNAGAIERTFPLYSPTIKSIKVLQTRKVRRAKLFYLRDRLAKEYRV